MKKKSKYFLIFLSLIFVASVFLFLKYSKNNIFAGENFGGWSYDNFFGWTSESCNNLYGSNYSDYCGLGFKPVLDISFDNNDLDFKNSFVKDNAHNFNGELINFTKVNIRNGGKNKFNGNSLKNSNFDNSLYFNGMNSYIDFGIHDELNLSNTNFTISLWFKADEGINDDAYLFSNGKEINKKYHCWLDKNYYLTCVVNGSLIKTNDILKPEEWYSLVIVGDTNHFSMYLNNSLIATKDISNFFDSSKKLILGAKNDLSSFFKGEVDEFRIFDKSLDSKQILHNSQHNSNYLLNIEDGTGKIDGWIWSNGIGWICFGKTCQGLAPDGSDSEAKLYWYSQGENTYPHMITGWANAISFNNDQQEEYQNNGWISLQSNNISIADYDKYDSCVSCNFRDEESNLVMYLKMDEDTGESVIDSSGFQNNGVLSGFEDLSRDHDGIVNNCLEFDGQNDYLKVDASSSELQIAYSDFTIETWIKNENTEHKETEMTVISSVSKANWSLNFYPKENIIDFNIFGIDVQAEVSTINKWTHVLIRADRNNNLSIYINGILFDQKNISEFLKEFIDNDTLLIASNEKGHFWDGKIDIIRIYTRALSEEEISYNYNFPEKKFCSACLEEFKDEKQVTKICYACQRCKTKSSKTNCEFCSSCRDYGLVFDTNTANIKGFAWSGNSVNNELSGMGWFKFSPNFGAGLYRSYVSSKYGNIYSKENIGSDYSVIPPLGYANATYLIQANGHIMNWVSGASFDDQTNTYSDDRWYMSSDTGDPVNYEYPKLENNYANALGNLDYNGLINGLYGEVINKAPNDGIADYNVCLKNLVYFVNDNLVLDEKITGTNIAYKFNNCSNASGLIIVNGDLTINANIQYNTDSFSGDSHNLASVAWIVKGDLKLAPNVTELAGTFIVLGKDNVDCGPDLDNPKQKCGSIYTCVGEESDCGKQLQVSGQFLAKNFRFQRTFRSIESQLREAAENIIYDGRNVINPPPGLGDVLKVLPTWNQIAPY